MPLPGGDAAVERPYRMALAHLAAAGVAWDPALPPVAACAPAERNVLRHQLETGLNCVPTSSMGRLFDAVASLAGVRHTVDYEAQAAIELEGLARGVSTVDAPYTFAVSAGDDSGDAPIVADPGPAVRAAATDAAAGVPAALIGARFHRAVVSLVVTLALDARERGAGHTVVLSGGVFQNTLLLSGARKALVGNGFRVLCHRQVPPNDGGLALGQVLVAASGLG